MSVRLYIGNLSFDVKSEDLRAVFGAVGEVEDAIVVTRSGSSRSRGFGFVTMADAQDGAEAIRQLHGHPLAGRVLSINVAKDPKETVEA